MVLFRRRGFLSGTDQARVLVDFLRNAPVNIWVLSTRVDVKTHFAYYPSSSVSDKESTYPTKKSTFLNSNYSLETMQCWGSWRSHGRQRFQSRSSHSRGGAAQGALHEKLQRVTGIWAWHHQLFCTCCLSLSCFAREQSDSMTLKLIKHDEFRIAKHCN